MSFPTDRRTFLKSSAAIAAGLLLTSTAQVRAKEFRWRDGLVIDGNLVPPIDDAAVLDRATTRAVKSSGLTALKATIGGSNSDFAQTTAELDGYDKGIALNAALYMKIGNAADFARARRTGKGASCGEDAVSVRRADRPRRHRGRLRAALCRRGASGVVRHALPGAAGPCRTL